MTWKPHQRNNFLAGLFLVTALILAVVVSVILSGDPFTRTRTYQTRFTLTDGATGLDRGSPVMVGGHEVGQVVGVKLDLGHGDDGVVVTFETERDVQLHADAWVTLERPLLGSLSAINIPSIGTGAPADETTVLAGSIAPPSFLRDAGWRDEERTKLQRIITAFDNAAQRTTQIVETVDPDEAQRLFDELSAAVDDVTNMIGEAKQAWPGWSDHVDSTLTSLDEAGGKLPGAIDNLDEGVTEARTTLSDNRERIDAIIDNVEATTTAVNEQWVPRGSELLDSATRATGRLTELIEEHRTDINKMFANGRLASDQLKLAILEIRAQPWRLLIKPTKRQFESQVLYDAARTYAMAVSDLRAASDALASLEGSGAVDEVRLAELRAELDEDFRKYREAESKLLDQMIEEKP